MPRKLEPGLEATYSNPRDLITSTMKSEPGRSAVETWGSDAGSDSRGGTAGSFADCDVKDCCARAVPVLATKVATLPTVPAAAAAFKKVRRPTPRLSDFFMGRFSVSKSRSVPFRCGPSPEENCYREAY